MLIHFYIIRGFTREKKPVEYLATEIVTMYEKWEVGARIEIRKGSKSSRQQVPANNMPSLIGVILNEINCQIKQTSLSGYNIV